MPGKSLIYDLLCIRGFIIEQVQQIDNLCFFLENEWNKRYAKIHLSPGRLATQAQEIVQIARLNDEVGELVFYLCRYWLDDYGGNPEVLAKAALTQQLALYARECQEKGNLDRLNEVQRVITADKVPAEDIPKSSNDVNPPWNAGDHQPQVTVGNQNEVFVSYAWGGESERMVDDIERALAAHGIPIVRDKKDLGYRGSIKLFEQRIGRGDCIILVISDKYLRSPHCMYELVEADEHSSLRDRIFPVVLADAHIHKATDRLAYIQHWDKQIEDLNKAIKEVNVMTDLKGIIGDLDKFARIRANFDQLVDLLKDMNTLTPEIHAASGFSTLIDAIEHRCGAGTHKGE